MAALEPMVRGKLASHPEATAFAAEVLRVHRRYATEIVQAYALCPFTRDVDVAFGKFCVMLDREPDQLEGDVDPLVAQQLPHSPHCRHATLG